ncbi:MAG: hypothetical protein U0X91_32695 [Spirosomataceae bacterium]
MKKLFLISLFSAFLAANHTNAQKMLQEVIVDYVNLPSANMVNKVMAKNKPIKVSRLKGTSAAFYRVTVFQPEKVNTYTRLYESLRLVNPDTLAKAGYDYNKHLLEANGNFNVAVGFFEDASSAEKFLSGKEASPCFKIDSTKSSAGVMEGCRSETFYVAVKPLDKKSIGSIKVEIVALADVIEDPVNDRFPFSIQNELSGEVAYEISGDRQNWQAFYLPTKKRAEFKLADSQVYMRVSTLEKVTEEYKIDSGKKYRLYWNKDKNRLDLGEIPAKK